MFEVDMVHSLSSLPATDLNFTSCLKRATKEQIEKAIEIMEQKETGNKSRITACKRELKKRSK